MIYYFIVYVELRYISATLLLYVKRLYSAAPYWCSQLKDHLEIRVIENRLGWV